MSEAEDAVRRRLVGQWLSKAETDRRAVELCLAADPPLRSVAAFHAQQAAEKLMKGFLVLASVRVRKTHDLGELGRMVAEAFPGTSDTVQPMAGWSGWNSDFRYPAGAVAEIEPSVSELREALVVVDRLASMLKQELRS